MDEEITPTDVERLADRLAKAEAAVGEIERLKGMGFGAIRYPEAITALFDSELAQPRWCASDYEPSAAGRLDHPERVAQADLAELRRMLTAAWRGERFCDGWWRGLLEQGSLWPVVERLRKIVE